MPDEYGRSFNEHGQRYIGSVRRNSAAGTQGYWSTDTGRGPNWELIFIFLYGVYKVVKFIYRATVRLLDSRNSEGSLDSDAGGKLNGADCEYHLPPSPLRDNIIERAQELSHEGSLNNQSLDIASLVKMQHKKPLEIARECGFLYSASKGAAELVDYLSFKQAVKAYTADNNEVFLENMHIYGPLLGATIERLNAGIQRLTGDKLLRRLRAPEAKNMTKPQLAILTGYNFVGSDWRERIHYTLFYQELLKARGIDVSPKTAQPQRASGSRDGAAGTADRDDLDQLLRQAEKSVRRTANLDDWG